MPEKPEFLFEYYQLPFAMVMQQFGPQIEAALITDREQVRRNFWNKHSGQITDTETAWKLVKEYSDYIEEKMARVIRGHSVFFWIHLYRRIGVHLHKDLPSKTDAPTISLVRNVMESAFIKYGSLTDINDVKDATTVAEGDILSGWYTKSLEQLKQEVGDRPFPKFSLGKQLVIVRFSEQDYIDAYRLEGLAYEYWRATAKLRAIGKGVSITVEYGDVFEDRSDAMDELLALHDARSERSPFMSSQIGVTFDNIAKTRGLLEQTLLPIYNVHQEPHYHFAFEPKVFDKSFVANFVLAPFNMGSFVSAHAFATEAFREKHGFGYEELCLFLAATAHVPLLESAFEVKSEGEAKRALEMAALNLSRRGYYARGRSADSMIQAVLEVVDMLGGGRLTFGKNVKNEARAIYTELALSAERQAAISLWSNGPRAVFVPHGDTLVVDLQGIPIILNTLFFGVRYDQTARGTEFENAFRELVRARKCDLLAERELVADGGEQRETDAAVRIGDRLFLCDCRSIWMPLNYEIGYPQTLSLRRKYLEKKLDRLRSMEAFVKANPRGRNYDFSWAKEIVAVGVSPFIEWTWDLGDFYWLAGDKKRPRMLAVSEALELFSESRLALAAKSARTASRRRILEARRRKNKAERSRRTLARRLKKHL